MACEQHHALNHMSVLCRLKEVMGYSCSTTVHCHSCGQSTVLDHVHLFTDQVTIGAGMTLEQSVEQKWAQGKAQMVCLHTVSKA